MAAILACGAILAAVNEESLVHMALFGLWSGVFLRDTWAWFAATEEERAAFRSEVERLMSHGWSPPPDQVVIGRSWGWTLVVVLLECLVLSIALVAFVHPPFLVGTMYVAAFLVVALLDRVRVRTRKNVT
ncbi:hypothetical protein JY651_42450 [Pyxidicoccus parkwayensis]|uniref:Uncharacterized protein n=1 Tax=Pyxidicoccus parkwayensis TaxID=2813578 RepID=A0ABX7NTE1_9BACT|nr:hypothetical protein [Pyxidicoccus parkwaysis]QSQ21748.1 hypothetical protein JY651_42450 [Pyxidicoccus parkwaysis]